ncbi:MAG: hypothetical protein KF708_17170 [Pirellulales bacterium]|nr:hypothetical protein [Pirellulales bacterium]
MKRFALWICLSLAVFAGTLTATAGKADAGPWAYRPYRAYRPYAYRPYVYRPYAYPYRAYYAPPVYYGPPAYGYYYGPGVSVGVGWY